MEGLVESLGGDRAIRRILVANNGLAAVKGVRSLRRWTLDCIGDDRAIKFISMATREDIDANAEYVSLADEIVEVAGGPNYCNFANVEVICDVAHRARADAVWAGWGHASENPDLPASLAKLSPPVIFIGPGPDAMRELGDKIASTVVAQTVNVPCLPWSGDGVKCKDIRAGVTEEEYNAACVANFEDAQRRVDSIGFPVMIKAAEGGGGKGIRRANSHAELRTAYDQVCAEVAGCHVFIMQLASNMRHLEVQVIADQHGGAVSLWGRDCSVQRRHQKILEEGPVVFAEEEECNGMQECAVVLAKSLGYVGAGTVEFLYGNGKYYFLEMNPRLQVEHPVTELVSGVSIPAAMYLVACGVHLSRIPDIARLYNVRGDQVEDLPATPPCPPKCHAIAARITAENPDAGFQPSSGAVHEVRFRSLPDGWAYFAVLGGGGVHEYADSQLGHVFARGATREAARRALVCALRQLTVHGEIRVTTEYLGWLLNRDEYVNGSFHTQWLDGILQSGPRDVTLPVGDLVTVLCGVVCQAHSHFEEVKKDIMQSLRHGRVPFQGVLNRNVQISLMYKNFKYQFDVQQTGATSLRIVHRDGSYVDSSFLALSDGALLIQIDGSSYECRTLPEADGMRLLINGYTALFTEENDPSRLKAAIPGKIIRFLVDDGEHVSAGQPYVEVEVMKMYMNQKAPESGRITHVLREGAIIKAGDLVATLDLDDESAAPQAQKFEGPIPQLRAPYLPAGNVLQRLREVIQEAAAVMSGYYSVRSGGEEGLSRLIHDILDGFANSELPVLGVEEALSVCRAVLPPEYVKALTLVLSEWRSKFEGTIAYSIDESELGVWGKMHQELSSIPDLPPRAANLKEALQQASSPAYGHLMGVLSSLLVEFYSVERKFAGRVERKDVVVSELLEEGATGASQAGDSEKGSRAAVQHQKIMEVLLAHKMLPQRVKLVSVICSLIGRPLPTSNSKVQVFASSASKYEGMVQALKDISELPGAAHSNIAFQGRQALLRMQMPDKKKRLHDLETALAQASSSCELEDIVRDCPGLDEDLPMILFRNLSIADDSSADNIASPTRTTSLRAVALEAYIRRSHRIYNLSEVQCGEIEMQGSNSILCAGWQFSESNSTLIRRSESSIQSLQNLGGGVNSPRTPTDGNSVPSASELERSGLAIVLDNSSDELSTILPIALKQAASFGAFISSLAVDNSEHGNCMYIMMRIHDEVSSSEKAMFAECGSTLKHLAPQLSSKGISRVTAVLSRQCGRPLFYTFRRRLDFGHDELYQNIDPPLAFQLELSRLTSHYDIDVMDTQSLEVHAFLGKDRSEAKSGRVFVRTILEEDDVHMNKAASLALRIALDQIEGQVAKCLDTMEAVYRRLPTMKLFANHIFLNVLPAIPAQEASVADIIKQVVDRHSRRARDLRVTEFEFNISCSNGLSSGAGQQGKSMRILVTNASGLLLQSHAYVISNTDGKLLPVSPAQDVPALAGSKRSAPYPALNSVDRRRLQAQLQDTTFCYDIPNLLNLALREEWACFVEYAARQGIAATSPSGSLMEAIELVPTFGDRDQVVNLQEKQRAQGSNECGTIAWLVKLKTPEFPGVDTADKDEFGRHIVLIVNDLSVQNGSFGPRESSSFRAFSEYARGHGLPRIYCAANSGARIGLAREVQSCFNVKWKDDSDPTKGIDFLFLADKDADLLNKQGAVVTERHVDADGVEYHRITDVIGTQHGLGVENLQGSGAIAGETSRAYHDIFTLTYVMGHAVGIGAYLVRLGQRVIQKGPPILLTGAAALNKVLGKQVYLSNFQLGGTQIMYNNGVSHKVVEDDLAGMQEILRWLSFVPARAGQQSPQLGMHSDGQITSIDPADRNVEWCPPANMSYDARMLFTGGQEDSQSWLGGLVDKDSFQETLAGWAKTVIVGRARIGGIPVGVITPESQMVTLIKPADPADNDSKQQILQQPGQVWFPDSAHKTAQAIRDFSHGENLPIVILANWRGFSGGMRDMFDEVLKFGSLIVDALVQGTQPVFVVLPPHAELRGGAWVVIDPEINNGRMEMYADPRSKGGILEPQGTVEIKFRRPALLEAMRRLDPTCASLDEQIKSCTDALKKVELSRKLQQRQETLLPVFQQVAVQFASLHDTPTRMMKKGCLTGVVPWEDSRRFLFGRLRRRLAEEQIVQKILALDSTQSRQSAIDSVTKFTKSICGNSASQSLDGRRTSLLASIATDHEIANKLKSPSMQSKIQDLVLGASREHVRTAAAHLAKTDLKGAVEGLVQTLLKASPEERVMALTSITAGIRNS